MRTVAQLLVTFLLNAAWQIAFVSAFAAVGAWLLRGAAAWCRHSVWVAALVLSLGLPLATCLTGVASVSRQPAPFGIKSNSVSITSTQLEPLETREPLTPTPPVAHSQPAVDHAQPALSLLPWGLSLPPIRISGNLGAVLVGAYLLFLLYRGAKLFQAWLRTRTIVRGVYSVPFPEPVQTVIKKCRTAIGVARVRIVCSPGVAVPVTAGVFNPLIILPEELLRESDTDLLASAVGHELVHVARHDYVLNLLYELIYLPLAFHPAAALLRRRIKQTRELCCDELIARELLRPEVYARSLVRLIGSAPLGGRLAADTTIGITDADILEVRIMSLLRRPKLSARRRTLLLIAASLLLITPCVAAASFALRFELGAPAQARNRDAQETLQRAREELKRKELELTERLRNNPNLQGAELEAVRRLERELHQAATKLRQEEDALQSAEAGSSNREIQEALARIQSRYFDEARNREAKQKLAELEKLYTQDRIREVQEAIAKVDKSRPESEARMRELQEALALVEKSRPESDRQMQQARERFAQIQRLYQNGVEGRGPYRVEPQYSEDARAQKIEGAVLLAVTVDPQGLPQDIQVTKPLFPSLDANAVAALRQWRFQPYLKDGQPISKRITVEMHFSVNDWQKKEKTKERYKEALKEHEAQTKSEGKVLELRRSKKLAEGGREERSRRQVELTQGASISMDRAIQIATSKYPGKVLACSLGRDGEGRVFYHLVIISTEGEKSTTSYVWISALDGQILKDEKE